MKHVSEIVKKVRTQLIRENTKKSFEISVGWKAVVDDRIARRTCVTGLKQKILYVKVKSPALLNELCNFKKGAILARLQAKYPDHKIREIKFTI